jgi:hypothetical protein
MSDSYSYYNLTYFSEGVFPKFVNACIENVSENNIDVARGQIFSRLRPSRLFA